MIHNNEHTKRLWAASRGFLKAAEAIHDINPEPFHWPAFYTNAYYCIEIGFKAFLASRGLSLWDLKKVSHDLVRAQQRAISLGFEISDHRLVDLVGQLDGKLFDLRYLQSDGFEVLEAGEVLDVLEKHVQNVELCIPLSAME